MAYPKMKASDPMKMGQLIKRWSLDPGSAPTSLDDFLEQVAEAGFEVTFPGYPDGRPTDLAISRQPPMDVLYITIPPPDAIEEAIADITAKGSYPLPEFYNDAFVEATRRSDLSDEEIETFNLKRLCEYTTTKCQ